MLPKFLKSFISEQINSEFSKLLESLELKDMTDDEIIKKYKHTQWKDLNIFYKNILKNRYNLSEGFSIGFTFVDVFPNSYISDVIERVLRLKEFDKRREEMMLNSLEKASNISLNNDTKKKTKRKPQKLGDEEPKSNAKKIGEE